MPKKSATELLEDYAQALELEHQGMNYVQIGEAIGMTPSGARRLLVRAHKSAEVIVQRQREAWDLRQKAFTHDQIAESLGVDRSTVSKILKRLSERTLRTLDEEVRVTKIGQWSQLEFIISEAMRGWEASKEAQRQVTQTQSQPKSEGTEGPSNVTVTTRVSDQDGNIAFLKEAREAMSDLRELLGLNQPVKHALTDPTGETEARGQILFFIPDNGRDTDRPASGTADGIPVESG